MPDIVQPLQILDRPEDRDRVVAHPAPSCVQRDQAVLLSNPPMLDADRACQDAEASDIASRIETLGGFSTLSTVMLPSSFTGTPRTYAVTG